jgi:hypothetical protein
MTDKAFQDHLNHLAQLQSANKKQQTLWATLRALLFLAILAGVVLATGLHAGYWMLTALSLAAFLGAVSKHLNLQNIGKLLNLQIRIHTYEKESESDLFRQPSTPTQNAPHVGDLDLMGPHSLFAAINRSCTPAGANLLASRLENPYSDISEIVAVQQAAAEMAPHTNFRQRMMAQALRASSNLAKAPELPDMPSKGPAFKVLLWCWSVCSLVIVVGGLYGLWHYMFTFLIFGINFFIVNRFLKASNTIASSLSAYENTFEVYGTVFQLFQEKPFESAMLQKDQATGKEAAGALKLFQKLVNAYEQRNNLVVGLLFNGLVLYDLHLLYRYQIWTAKHGESIPEWFAAIARLDYLFSLAQWQAGHPEFATPKLNTTFLLDAKNMAHPLIPKEKRVGNDLQLVPETGKCLVITGSNMSGKSTFLRALGVNVVLARIGAVVCANAMTLNPMRLLTAIRVTDDLHEGTSYFFAELKRLAWIRKQLEDGKPSLVLLDEILRGTNSDDKLSGTKALVQVLANKNAFTLMATHDLALGELERIKPFAFRNLAFESTISGSELHFDYKVRPGIAQNRNATFLMKQQGII